MSQIAELHCVQCGAWYQEVFNGEGSCKFHTSSKWGNKYQCCNQNNNGCQTNKHRSEHHCDYKYYTFIEQVAAVLNYTDANKEWAMVEDSNILTQAKFYCQAGIVTKGMWKGRLFIVFNSRWNFYTFTVDDLKNKFNDITNDTEKLIKEYVEPNENNNNEIQGSSDVKDFCRALWRIEGGKITGITIMCQSKTSPTPDHCVVEFNINNNNNFEHVKNTFISRGGIVEYKPKTPYQFPIPPNEFQYEGAILEKNVPNDADKEIVKKDKDDEKEKEAPFEPVCYGSLPLKIIQNSFIANPTSRTDGDFFILELTIMNTESKSFVIMNVESEYKLKGDTNWTKIPPEN